MDTIKIKDSSGDRKYFTIIPNYIANHSTANDQALYFQMKRFAGEDGECFASEVTLMEKLGIGRKALKKSINYLLDHRGIKLDGVMPVPTKGGMQDIKDYSIVDIWQQNVNEYQGVAESTPLTDKGSAERTGGVGQELSKGVVERASNKNQYNKNHIKKTAYGEFLGVLLTPNEYQKLIDLMGEDNVKGLIFELDTYIASKGKQYKSHYATLQSWARRKAGEQQGKRKEIIGLS